MTRRFPFLLALILVSLCHARCKARSAPGGASLTFGGSEVTVEGTLVEARGYFATKEVGGDRAFAPFLETLAGQAPQVLAQVLRTHLSMLGARGTREPWVRRLFRDHYRFRTVVGEECTWEQLVRQASPPAEEDDDARRVLHVYSDIALPPELLGMAGNLGVTIVLAEPAERALLEAIAADEGVRITGVSELVAGISGDVPPSFLQLRARMAVHIRRRGVDRIEFFHVAADVAPPAMFRVGLADEPGRRGAEARHPSDGGVVVYPEALLLNLGHPLLEELARRVGDLPPDLVRRAAEHLFCIATLKAPFEQTKCPGPPARARRPVAGPADSGRRTLLRCPALRPGVRPRLADGSRHAGGRSLSLDRRARRPGRPRPRAPRQPHGQHRAQPALRRRHLRRQPQRAPGAGHDAPEGPGLDSHPLRP